MELKLKVYKIEDDRILLEIPIVTKFPKEYREVCDCVLQT